MLRKFKIICTGITYLHRSHAKIMRSAVNGSPPVPRSQPNHLVQPPPTDPQQARKAASVIRVLCV